jgi:hypothetical protein
MRDRLNACEKSLSELKAAFDRFTPVAGPPGRDGVSIQGPAGASIKGPGASVGLIQPWLVLRDPLD